MLPFIERKLKARIIYLHLFKILVHQHFSWQWEGALLHVWDAWQPLQLKVQAGAEGKAPT